MGFKLERDMEAGGGNYKNAANLRRKKRREFWTSENMRGSDGKAGGFRRISKFPTEFPTDWLAVGIRRIPSE